MDVRSKFVEEDMESVDFKDCVATVLSEAIRNEVGELEWQPSNLSEQKKFDELVAAGCGCQKGLDNASCSSLFITEYISTFRFSCAELSKEELDMLAIGQIVVPNNLDPKWNSILCNRDFCHYMYQGKTVCARTFMFHHVQPWSNELVQYQILPIGHGTNIDNLTILFLLNLLKVFLLKLSYAEQNALLLW